MENLEEKVKRFSPGELILCLLQLQGDADANELRENQVQV